MSDVTPTPDDELVSAYLDGEATAEERALVDSRPDLVARVATLRRIADEIGFTPAPPDGARDTAIAAAVAAAAAPVRPAADPAPMTDAAVTDLALVRRRRRHGRAIAILGAAAAVVLVVVVGVAVLRARSSSTQVVAATNAAPDAGTPKVASGSGSTAAAGVGAGGSGAAANDAAGATPAAPNALTAGAGRAVGDLGSFPDTAALGRAVGSYVQVPAGAEASTSGGSDGAPAAPGASRSSPTPADAAATRRLASCVATRRADEPALGDVSISGQAIVDGERVDVFVFSLRSTTGAGAGPSTGHELVIVTPDCQLVSSQPL